MKQKQKRRAHWFLFLGFLLWPLRSFALQAPFDVRVSDPRLGGALNVSWAHHNEGDIDFAQVYRSDRKEDIGARVFDLIKTNFVADTGLIDGQKYFYTIVLIDKNGNPSPASSQASGVPSISISPPSGPNNVRITDMFNGNSLKLEWSPPAVPNIAYFRIYRRLSGSQEFLIIADRLRESAFTDIGLEADKIYEYAVKAVSTAGIESTNSPVSAAATLDQTPPGSPLNFQIDDTERGGELKLAWQNPNSPDLRAIRIYRSSNGGRGVIVAEVPNRATSYLDSNLEVGRQYLYTLTAVDKAGLESQPTSQLKARPTYPGAVQSPAANFTARDRGTGGVIELSWNSPSDRNFSHLRLYRSTAENDQGLLIADNLKSSSFTDKNIANGVTFYYTLRPVSKSNIEGPSSQIKAVATANLKDKKRPVPPVNISVQDAGNGSALRIRFAVADETGLSHFRIYRSEEAGKLGELVADNYHFTSFDDKNLKPDQTYYYVARSVGVNGMESDNIRQGVGIPTAILPEELAPGNDSDADGLPDLWERSHGFHIRLPDDTSLDLDGDGLSTLDEYRWGTNPWDPDTDGDTFLDGLEIKSGYSPIQGRGVRLELKLKQKMPSQKSIKTKQKGKAKAKGKKGNWIF